MRTSKNGNKFTCLHVAAMHSAIACDVIIRNNVKWHQREALDIRLGSSVKHCREMARKVVAGAGLEPAASGL